MTKTGTTGIAEFEGRVQIEHRRAVVQQGIDLARKIHSNSQQEAEDGILPAGVKNPLSKNAL